MEPSAQNIFHIPNFPSHKLPAKLNLFLFWQARRLRGWPRRFRGLQWPDHFVGDGRYKNLSTVAPNGHLLSSTSRLAKNRSSLSQLHSSQAPQLQSQWFLEGLSCDTVRKLKKIVLLHSRALGETLAAWCVFYTWSFAPSWLEVDR
jgi:hypothetical protein